MECHGGENHHGKDKDSTIKSKVTIRRSDAMIRKKSAVPIDALDRVSMENVLALNDASLSRLCELCHHWHQLADQERRRRRKETQGPRGKSGAVFLPVQTNGG